MCKFYSAVISKNGELYHNQFTTSHEDIVSAYNLRDNGMICRVEFYPDDDKDIFSPSKYKLHLDDKKPLWWTEEISEKTERSLLTVIKRMIITEDQDLVLGKCVLLNGCKVSNIKNSIVYYMENSHVNVMLGNSQVNEMWGNSQVNEMWGNSQVNVMLENSHVNVMLENSHVNVMRGNSQVNEMWGNSQVNEMRGNSQVNEMWGNSKAPRKPIKS